MGQDFLKLNKDKTEILVFDAKDGRLKVRLHLESLSLKMKKQARNPGVINDSDLNFNSHSKSAITSAYYPLKKITRLRGLMSEHDLERLVHAIII